jgi:hypothetical protein
LSLLHLTAIWISTHHHLNHLQHFT